MLSAILILATLSAEPIHQQTPEQVTQYLHDLQSQDQPFEQRIREIVGDSLGMEYNDGPLGEGVGGKYDADPLIDLKRVDCVTFVEQTVALSMTPSYEDMVDFLQTIRYKDGKIDYEHRNHFMITDWVRNNPYCKDITAQLGVDTSVVERTISRKNFFERVEAPGLGLDTPDEVVPLTIVPTSLVENAELKLPDTALVVFVGKVDWLFALHCGLYIRNEKGEGKLVHASSKSGEVVEMSLVDYMHSQAGRYLGFTAYELTEPK